MPRFIALDRSVITIGRSYASDLVLADNRVSRQHAQLHRKDGAAVIRDLNSTYGTFVNGKRISGPCRVRPGDLIVMGRTELIFQGPPGRRQPAKGGQLAVARGASYPSTVGLRRNPIVFIGRSRRNDVVISSDPEVSRRHARIQQTPRGYELTDLGSRNGVFVNGQRVARAWLQRGDRIRLGKTEFIYRE